MRLQIVTLIRVRTINAVEVDFLFVDVLHVGTVSICPTRAEMYGNTTCFIHRLILDLHAFETFVFINNQIKRRMFRHGIQDYKPLLKQIELSF